MQTVTRQRLEQVVTPGPVRRRADDANAVAGLMAEAGPLGVSVLLDAAEARGLDRGDVLAALEGLITTGLVDMHCEDCGGCSVPVVVLTAGRA